mgnify:CR=1 FL=1
MATKKTIKPTFIPAFTVDLTNCENARDAYNAFLSAKIEAYILPAEEICNNAAEEEYQDEINNLNCSLQEMIDDLTDKLINTTKEAVKAEQTPKKPGMLKRFWNWVTRKK